MKNIQNNIYTLNLILNKRLILMTMKQHVLPIIMK